MGWEATWGMEKVNAIAISTKFIRWVADGDA
jgi:hypothetical protein